MQWQLGQLVVLSRSLRYKVLGVDLLSEQGNGFDCGKSTVDQGLLGGYN